MKLESIIVKAATILVVVFALGGCGQDDVTLPDAGSSAAIGECGAWYPGGDGDGGASYGFDVGDTLPCFVWESVRIGAQGDEPNAYLSMGELHLMAKHDQTDLLQAKFGVDEAKALVVAISAQNCQNCPGFLGAITDEEQALKDLGAVAVGLCRHPLGYSDDLLDLGTADTVLLEDDGWLENWHRTNDVEYNIPLDDQYPSILIVRLSDMKVVVFASANFFTPSSDLIPALENLDSY